MVPKETKRTEIFYGWFVVAAGFAATLTLGEAMWAFGVFFKPLENEFGWSRALVSSGYTTFLIGHGISGIATGKLADRYSPRPILFVSAIVAGLGTSLCSQIHSINELRIFLFMSGLGAGATWSVPTATVQRWFYGRPKAALALGTVVGGVGVGGLIFAPVINYLILNYGWRNAYLIIGVFYLCIISASSLVIRQSPSEVHKDSAKGEGTAHPVISKGLKTGTALTTPSYAGIALSNCVAILAFQAVLVHLVPFATDIGISPAASAVSLGLLGGCSVPGRVASGFVADRFGWQKIMAVALFGMALYLLWLSFLQGSWMLFAFVFFFGIFHGSRVSAHVGMLGEFFGMRSLGELIGINTAIAMSAGAAAPFFVGFVFDVTGSYFMAFMIMIVLLLSSGIIASVIRKPGTSQ
jgi:MFS family permease